MNTLKDFYKLLRAHFKFYNCEKEPRDLTITLSMDQVAELMSALKIFEEDKE